MTSDPRRLVPRTDAVLADPRLQSAAQRLGPALVKGRVVAAQQQARAGAIDPADVLSAALAALPVAASTLRPVLNATGVVVHTNLGRAPLSEAARVAVDRAAGYVDVEFDLDGGVRAARGRGALAALRAAVPNAGDVLIVNNGAAALLLAVTALAAGGEVLVSRGELVEIGDGFRLPDLIQSAGARIREVGTTNRTNLADYAVPGVDCILKIHPSNFQVIGFTSAVGVAELSALGPPVVVDVGSGLLSPDPLLPDEPDVTATLQQGAQLVTASGDKLLGGPQAGLIFGDAVLIDRLRRHPMARALRVDKLTLAALEATVAGPRPPVTRFIRADRDQLRQRCVALADAVGGTLVESAGRVGGGGAPGIELDGWAVALPAELAGPLRRLGVVGRVQDGRLLLDLRCVQPEDDAAVRSAVEHCLS